ncbi:N-acetyltransferase [Lactobacillus agilis]|uniref:GNAT family acetyltransferase n=1 Tax=Ligilactobacillus agilis TaxID=1601 RepID=A0A6F9Y1J6_9LACO|nr:N-acetyltransferase [Ligilactobacillus agilis]MBM6773506.1 N-acetyltransferase [Ligilactobacillus agilis]MDO4597954.1 N-acetyltransferase [Ligilactobacillus agilis]NME42563.1 N-acetyltransferase [Ligilactobacillus agilis]GET11431.1 GNAT family acetyltransferase [Ligilactobacillus agilis]GET13562.1 GNAT family acetyltransferase [Ligilactobacillus agilis]
MIRTFRESDLSAIMKIWLDTNIKTHNFISEEYWTSNYDMVKEILPKAEIYVYEDDVTNLIDGFIGLTNSYIAGLFVKDTAQSKGIGKQLLDYAKSIKSEMSLSVYQENVRAVHFYKREQFQIQSESVDDNTNANELIMTWNK